MLKENEVGGENIFMTEPVVMCPDCGERVFAEFDDNGFGPYSVQVSPYHCECGYIESCPRECLKDKCCSYGVCHKARGETRKNKFVNLKQP